MAEKVLSIEIGPQLTKVVETERNAINVVHNAFYFATPEGTIENGIVKNNAQFRMRLEDGLKTKGIKTKKAVFVIQATNIGNKEEVIPKMKDKQIKDYINTNAASFFPNSGDAHQFIYRNNGTNENGQMRAQLFAIPKNIIRGFEQLAESCKLGLVDVELVENGIAKAVREHYPMGTVVSIDVESICTYLTIIKNGEINLQRMIPFGIDEAISAVQDSTVFSGDMAFDETLDKMHANQCFHKHLSDLGTDDDLDVATEEVRFVIGNLTRFIDYYVSQHTGDKIDNVIISGLATYCKGFPELVANELNREMVLADNALLRDVANKNNVPNLGIYLSALAAAANADNTIIDKSTARKSLSFDKSALVRADDDFSLAKKVLIGAVIIVGIAILISVGMKIFFSVKSSNLVSDINSLQDAKEVYNELSKAKADNEVVVQVDDLATSANDNFLLMLNEMEANIPTDVIVTSISADTDAVAVDIESPSKDSIAATLSAFRNSNTVDVTNTIDITSTTNEAGATMYTSTIKCAYKSANSENSDDASDSSSSSSTSGSSTSSNSTNNSSSSSSTN